MAKNGYLNYSKFTDFIDKLLQQDRAQFQALTEDSKLVARTTLQSAVDAADTSLREMAIAVVMLHESWLYVSEFPGDRCGSGSLLTGRRLLVSFSASGASVVAIDNKIEQAMDLVKNHLMYAVREEVEILKEQIKELVEKNSQLERENSLLKTLASPEQLEKFQSWLPAEVLSAEEQGGAAAPAQHTRGSAV
ncbi:TSC22 domain family protein 3-like [Chelonoidis abingdonii]|uniref:TSC22 domain family protein 3-like n=1 Tax=Chelonoidis abingdonii TaxID=106734 RepID=UPI0013F1C808|nr:TSC22 domain family protein 3-like [Chelonoidis abingdonii]